VGRPFSGHGKSKVGWPHLNSCRFSNTIHEF
jgi:hypothetical protein